MRAGSEKARHGLCSLKETFAEVRFSCSEAKGAFTLSLKLEGELPTAAL